MLRPADELGPVLSSRFVGEELRKRIESLVTAGADVCVDFEGVIMMSPSFADELFAKLPRELLENKHVRFENLDEDLLPLVRFVIEGRPAAL